MEDVGDELTLEYLRLLESLPDEDHITKKHKMQFSGIIKRIRDTYDELRHGSVLNSNIYAPTSAIDLFKQINKFIPDHQLILADFDCFLHGRRARSLMGIN